MQLQSISRLGSLANGEIFLCRTSGSFRYIYMNRINQPIWNVTKTRLRVLLWFPSIRKRREALEGEGEKTGTDRAPTILKNCDYFKNHSVKCNCASIIPVYCSMQCGWWSNDSRTEPKWKIQRQLHNAFNTQIKKRWRRCEEEKTHNEYITSAVAASHTSSIQLHNMMYVASARTALKRSRVNRRSVLVTEKVFHLE